jgi:predicted flap endonuclease-1-like 5' DNA nuclease
MTGAKRTELPAQFEIEATYDEAKSKEQGRPVYVDREIITISVGRDTLRREVTADDKRRYAAQYPAWRKGEDQTTVEGFPLAQWGALPGKAIAKEMAFFGIRTVEQLAAATDSTIQRIGPHIGLRQKARDWVADAEKQAPLVKLRSENEDLRHRLEALEDMVQKQTRELEAARNNGGTLPQAAQPLPDIAAIVAQQVAQAMAQLQEQPERKKPGPKPKAKPEEN